MRNRLNSKFSIKKFIYTQKKYIEALLNYFYIEFLQMLLSVFAWKGIYDLIDTGLEQDLLRHLAHLEHFLYYSWLISFLVGYFIFFLFMFVQEFKLRKGVEEIMQIFAYFSIVMIWRTYWECN